jgi:cobalt-zinc-cadmium efflux system protein
LNKLKLAAGLSLVYMLAEAAGGWYTNSLALVADAGHMFTDVVAMSLTLVAAWFAERPATAKKTYGYYRLEILAAFANGNLLILLSIWVVYEALHRLRGPAQVLGSEMTVIAFGGLAVNLIAVWLLSSAHKHDLNLRGAWLHVIGDLLGSVAAIVAGVLILVNGWYWADAVSSIAISVIIVYGSVRLTLESVNILLEGTPRHIDIRSVETAILETDGVTGVHDLHIWTISSGIEALSAHINHNDSQPHSKLLGSVREMLHDTFGIDHLTIQMETVANETEALYVCSTGTKCFEPSAPMHQSHQEAARLE